jgi:PhoPQ-activated pathogenicity-related protein
MKRTLSFLAVIAFVFAAQAESPRALTALDRYVAAPDSNYRFELVKTIPGQGVTASVLELTSQAWRKPDEVDRTVWKHWLTVVRPAKVTTPTGFLFITGGANGSAPPEKIDPMLSTMAENSGAVTAELRMVPNQPLVFSDGKRRTEDSLIAYAWDKYLRGGDDEWLPRLPMTKSAVRAMDAITAFSATPPGGSVKVESFVVSGGSKRGWTTWTTAVVDRRVIGIAPLVIDMLNLEKSFIHHWQAYGFWAPAVHDYAEAGLMNWMGHPRYKQMLKIVEPYEYRDRLTVPKLIINSAGDQFFLPDSSQFYFDDLKGEKHLRYVPNTDHSLRNSDARETLAAFFDSIVRNMPRPRFTWKFEKNGDIVVKANDKPAEVKVWAATNPDKRDFRLESIQAAYQATTLAERRPGEYVASVPKPAKGWTAYFVELSYPTGGKFPIKLTTAVRVTPETLPFPPPKLSPPTQASGGK